MSAYEYRSPTKCTSEYDAFGNGIPFRCDLDAGHNGSHEGAGITLVDEPEPTRMCVFVTVLVKVLALAVGVFVSYLLARYAPK